MNAYSNELRLINKETFKILAKATETKIFKQINNEKNECMNHWNKYFFNSYKIKSSIYQFLNVESLK